MTLKRITKDSGDFQIPDLKIASSAFLLPGADRRKRKKAMHKLVRRTTAKRTAQISKNDCSAYEKSTLHKDDEPCGKGSGSTRTGVTAAYNENKCVKQQMRIVN